MRRISLQQSPILTMIVIPMTLLLLVSFGLHTFQVDHTHPGVHTADAHHQGEEKVSSLGEYLHGSEKKLFFLLLLGFFALGAFFIPHTHAILNRILLWDFQRDRVYVVQPPRVFDINIFLFSRGLLHSKAH